MSRGRERRMAYKHTLIQQLKGGGTVICTLCNKPIRFASDLTIDHLRPKAAGGKNDYNNFAPAHYTCNQAKGRTVIDSLIYTDISQLNTNKDL